MEVFLFSSSSSPSFFFYFFYFRTKIGRPKWRDLSWCREDDSTGTCVRCPRHCQTDLALSKMPSTWFRRKPPSSLWKSCKFITFSFINFDPYRFSLPIFMHLFFFCFLRTFHKTRGFSLRNFPLPSNHLVPFVSLTLLLPQLRKFKFFLLLLSAPSN